MNIYFPDKIQICVNCTTWLQKQLLHIILYNNLPIVIVGEKPIIYRESTSLLYTSLKMVYDTQLIFKYYTVVSDGYMNFMTYVL